MRGTASALSQSKNSVPRKRLNAVRHGAYSQFLLPGEDPAELDALQAKFKNDLKPEGITQEMAVRQLADFHWQLRRLDRYHAEEMQCIPQKIAEAKVRAALQAMPASSRSRAHVWNVVVGTFPREIRDPLIQKFEAPTENGGEHDAGWTLDVNEEVTRIACDLLANPEVLQSTPFNGEIAAALAEMAGRYLELQCRFDYMIGRCLQRIEWLKLSKSLQDQAPRQIAAPSKA